jgi:hypothetical protein
LLNYVADRNVVSLEVVGMNDEAWFHGVISNFNEVVCSGKWGPLVWENLSPEAKLIVRNLVLLDIAGYDVKCQLESG